MAFFDGPWGAALPPAAVVIAVLLLVAVAWAAYVYAGAASEFRGAKGGAKTGGAEARTLAGGPLAAELAAAGWTMYGSESCGACHEQLAKLGVEFGGGLAVDCKREACPGVEAYPTWARGDERRVGVQTVDELRRMARG